MAGEQPVSSVVSMIVSRGMQLIGKNAYTSWISKNMVQISDAVWSSRIRRKQFSGGSSSEGTTTSASDVDKMVVEPGVIVLMDSESPNQGSDIAFFRADPSRSNTGYVRLVPVNHDEMRHETYGNFDKVIETTPEGNFLSCDRFVDFIASLSLPPENCPDSAYRHGPCLTVDHSNIHGYAAGKAPGQVIEADVAYALELQDWPSPAREWFERERKHGWPTQETIDRIHQHKCHAVPVGDPTSKNPALEWRLSFLLGERELIWSFNDTQILCYVILKYLRKRFIEPLVPDQISSYHLKTIIFWLSEENGPTDWTEDSLFSCIDRCLSYLLSCIKERNLRHYFYKSNNLFRHKLTSHSDRQMVTAKITEIQSELVKFILDGGLSENCRAHKIWLMSRRNIDKFVEISGNDVELGDLFPLCKKVNDTRRRFQAMINTSFNIADCLDSLDALNRVFEDFEKHLPADVDGIYSTHIKHFIDIRIAIAMYKQLPREQGQILENERSMCQRKFADGAKFNTLSGNLYLATFYFSNKMYRECRGLASRQLSSPVKQYLYTGQCSQKPGLTVGLEGGRVEQTPDVAVTGEEDEQLYPAFDMLFSAEDLIFVPYPLKFECALFNAYGERVFFLHPCVYAYVLLFFTSFFEKDLQSARKALVHLEEIIQDSGFTYQRYRALNILGFCHSLAGDIDKAIGCFSQSLVDSKLLPNVTNAAAYHLAILAYGVHYGRTNDWVETLYQRVV